MGHRALLITCISAGLIGLGAVPAAASGYRYWTYWTGEDSAWRYSQLGPASVAVSDGDVHGWRFGISVDDGSLAPQPRVDVATAFDAACGSSTAVDGQVRVAIVIDPGDPIDAPRGQQPGAVDMRCAVIPTGSTGATALSDVAQLRIEKGFVCAVDGYPAQECAAPVEAASPAVSAAAVNDPGAAAPVDDTSPASTPMPLIVGGAAIGAGLLAAAIMIRRRT